MNEVDDAEKAVSTLESAINQGYESIPREEVAIVPAEVEYRRPWDRMDGETDFQYWSFLHYRDQGLGRTVRAVHRDSDGEKMPDGKVKTFNENHLYQVSRKFDWKNRVFQWDQDQEMQYQLARSEAIREMVGRHESYVADAIEALMTPIQALRERMDTDPDFIEGLSKASAAKLIDMAGKASRTIPSLMNAERLARGMPTEIVGGTVEHQLVVEVDRDQIGDVLDVLERAGRLTIGGGDLGSGEIIDAEVVDVYPVPAEGDND